jgi:hypothetical protein
MVKELIIMLMALSMKAIGPIIKFMESELTLGKMEKYIQVNGQKGICTDKEYLAGLMEEDTKVNICMIKSTGSEYILGKMEGSMQDSGKTVSSMAREYIRI